MFHTLGRALLFWLVLLETLAANRGWRGLQALRWPFDARALVPLPLLAFAGLRARWSVRLLALVLSAPLALVVHVGVSSWRNAALDPRLRLRPGQYGAYTVEAHSIAMDEGWLPALHVVPAGGTVRAVCVLHGSGCEKTYYAWPLVDALIAAGCAVLLVDLDGHGENPRMQRFPAILDDPRVAVAWLRERYMHVGLLGLSLGGCIAACAAADGLDVERLAVLEAPPKLHFTRVDVWREGAGLLRPYLLDLFSDSSVYAMVQSWRAPPIRAAISTWDLIDALDLLGSLPRLRTPTLLLYGGSDAIVKPQQARQAARVLPAGGRFRLLPGVSHLTLQVTPAALRELHEWFAQLGKSATADG